MPTLAETQEFFRDAIVTGHIGRVRPLLVGGRNVTTRLAVHQRNYQQSLVNALVGRFPATCWLAGSALVIDAARSFVREHPPQAPCIAEYGELFPRFLSAHPGAARMEYLRDFAEQEWHVGHISIAVEEPSLRLAELASFNATDLPDTALFLQSGLRYLRAAWPVDELMQLYLTDTAPDRLVLEPGSVCIELRGNRGEFRLTRLEESAFLFREGLAEGLTVAGAATRALAADEAFDPGSALVLLFTERLVTGFTHAS